jgi:hypothetical protein
MPSGDHQLAIDQRRRVNRHRPIPDQQAHLIAMMRGHYAYCGISGNFRRISWYAYQVARICADTELDGPTDNFCGQRRNR